MSAADDERSIRGIIAAEQAAWNAADAHAYAARFHVEGSFTNAGLPHDPIEASARPGAQLAQGIELRPVGAGFVAGMSHVPLFVNHDTRDLDQCLGRTATTVGATCAFEGVCIRQQVDATLARDTRMPWTAYVPPGTLSRGKQLATKYQCSTCHGANLEGIGPVPALAAVSAFAASTPAPAASRPSTTTAAR